MRGPHLLEYKLKVTVCKKDSRFIAFDKVTSIGTVFRCKGVYYMKIQTLYLQGMRSNGSPDAVNAACIHNGKVLFLEPSDLVEVLEAELVVSEPNE